MEQPSSFTSSAPQITTTPNVDIQMKCVRAVGKLSENLHIIANEPSLALYCLQEHVRKEVKGLITTRADFAAQHRKLQGTCYDCDYAIGAVKCMERSNEQFSSIQESLKNILFLRQQVRFEENRKKTAAAMSNKVPIRR